MDKDELAKEFLDNLMDFIDYEIHSRVKAIKTILQFRRGVAVEWNIEYSYLNFWLKWDKEKIKAVREAIQTASIVKEHLVKFIKRKLLVGDERQFSRLSKWVVSDFIEAVGNNLNNVFAIVQLLDQYSESSIKFVKCVEGYKITESVDKEVETNKEVKSYKDIRDYLDRNVFLVVHKLLKIINNFNGVYERSPIDLLREFTFNFGSEKLTIKGFKDWLKRSYSEDEIEKIVGSIEFSFVPFIDREKNITEKVVIRSIENKG